MPNPTQEVLHDAIKEAVNRKGKHPSAKSIAFVNRLYGVIMEAFESGDYKETTWTINQLASILFNDDDFITPKKQQAARYTLMRLRPILEEQDIYFYHVAGKGYCILHTREDFLRVAQFNLMGAATKMHIAKKVAVAGKVQNMLTDMIPKKHLQEAKALLALL